MFILIVLGILALIGVVATVIDVARDGYRRVPTDRTRVAEYSIDPIDRAEQSLLLR